MEKHEEKLDKDFILKSIKELGKKYKLSNVFEDVVKCCAYSLANQVEMKDEREKEFMKIIEKYNDEEKILFPKILASLMLEYQNANNEPIDILGDIYVNLELIDKNTSQFFTPIDVCKLMANSSITKEENKKMIEEKGYINVLDPACGSGRNLYASYSLLLENGIDENDILLVGADIDLICCCMTYIQLSLMGTNAIVQHQDSLTLDRYDTFYTLNYVLNKDLQNKISKNMVIEEDVEV